MKLRIALILLCATAIEASGQTITLKPITKLVYCLDGILNLSYTASGSFDSSNVFVAELSNSNGSFDSPTMFGSETGDTGSFQIELANTGLGYRVRVVSSDPVDSSADNGNDITVSNYPLPTVTLLIDGNYFAPTATDSLSGPAVMVGQVATFTASAFPSADSFYWSFNEDASVPSATGARVSVSYPTIGIKDGTVSIFNAAGCETTTPISIRVLDCEPTIPWYATIVTTPESVADSFVWVKPGGIDTMITTPYPQTVFVESEGSVYTTSEESWNTFYIKSGGMINHVPERSTIVSSAGVRDTFEAQVQADTLSCGDLEFQVSSGVTSEVPPPAFQIVQTGDRLAIVTEEGSYKIQILNMLGSEVLSQDESGSVNIDLSTVNAGIYFAVVEAGNKREIRKIAVVH